MTARCLGIELVALQLSSQDEKHDLLSTAGRTAKRGSAKSCLLCDRYRCIENLSIEYCRYRNMQQVYSYKITRDEAYTAQCCRNLSLIPHGHNC